MSQLQVTGEAKIRDIQGPVVANSGVITALDGAANQYVRGDGTLATFPTSGGGGSSVSYYLNGSVNQGTIGGVAYKELSKDPILGVGTDFTISANGYVASFITDANDPDSIIVPGGNWNTEIYFSVDSNSNSPYFYVEVYKYDGSTFTLLGSNQTTPEYITAGTTITPYYGAVAIPTTNTAITDRIAIRIYVVPDGRTVTLHTENSHLGQIVTTFSKGMTSLNNLTDQSQYLTTGTSGTDFNIVSSGDTHTFNIPSASATNRGLITTGAQTIAGSKTFSSTTLLNSVYIDGLSYLKHQASSGGGIAGYTVFNALTNGVLEYIFPTLFKSVLDFNDGADYTYTFPSLSGTLALLEGAQTFTGDKEFSGGAQFTNANGTYTQYGITLTKGSAPTGFFTSNVSIFSDSGVTNLVIANHPTYKSKLQFQDVAALTSNYTYTFPASSGTIALTSDLSAYVTLGTSQTITGAKTFANNVKIDNGVDGNYIGFKQYATGSTGTTGFTTLYSISTNGFGIGFGTTKAIQFDSASITTFRTYTFPDANGTLALTSDLSGYVTLATAQTITGAKTFSLDILVNSVKIGNANGSILNTVVGFGALTGTGVENTAFGYLTLSNNTTGNSNTAVGKRSLLNNTSASWNTAIGAESLFSNTTGVANVAIGYYSLFANTTGFSNVSVGYNSMTTSNGNENTAIGNQSMQLNTNGVSNTAIGHTALQNNTTGNNNIGIGYESGKSITTGNYNTIIGSYVGTAAMSNNIVLADGQGNVRYQWNGTNNVFGNPISGTTATFSSSVTAQSLSTPSTGGAGSTSWNFYHDQYAAGDFGLYAASTLRILVNAAGNVGIGTSSPTSGLGWSRVLDLQGSGSSAYINRVSGSTQESVFGTDGAGFYLDVTGAATASNNFISFRTVNTNSSYSATERMRITSGGDIYMGSSTITTANTSLYFEKGPGTVTQVFAYSSGSVFIQNFYRQSGASIGSITFNGTITSYNSTSDYRLKEDLKDYNALNIISKLKTYDFKWKEAGVRDYGMMAHELQEVLPNYVSGNKDAKQMQQVDYSKIVPILVKSIQELEARIKQLENK